MGLKAVSTSGGGGGGSGTVTEIDTGTGLTGGPITNAGTVSIATNTANTLAGFNNSGVFSDVAIGSGLTLSSGTLTASGGGSSSTFTYIAKTVNYTLLSTDCIAECTSGSPTFTLPTAVGIQGKLFILKNSGSGTLSWNTTSSQTVDGSTSGSFGQYSSMTVLSNGTNYIITA